MKRMYLILGSVFLLFCLGVTAIAQMVSSSDQSPKKQTQTFDRQKRRLELREEMHKRLRDQVLLGVGQNQDMLKDLERMMEDAMSEAMSEMNGLGGQVSNFSMEWQETTSGRTLVVIPQGPEQKLNIDVNSTAITIKSEAQEKTQHAQTSSAMTNSFPVPDDCDGSKVKMDQKDGKILVHFPFKSTRVIETPSKEERKPIAPSPEDVKI